MPSAQILGCFWEYFVACIHERLVSVCYNYTKLYELLQHVFDLLEQPNQVLLSFFGYEGVSNTKGLVS